jgi:hypothetical protein
MSVSPASASRVSGGVDQRSADPLLPQLGLDEQTVEFGMPCLGQHYCAADNAIAEFGDQHLTLFNLLGGKVDRVGMGHKVRAVRFVGQRGSPLQCFKRLPFARAAQHGCARAQRALT